MRSAFGVDHGDFSKAFNQIAGALERTVATAKPGSAAHTYATQRLAAGRQGAGVAQNIKASHNLTKPGIMSVMANRKVLAGNKEAVKAARVGRRVGRSSAKAAKGAVPGKTAGGIARMESSAAAAATPQPTAAKTPFNWKKPAALAGAGVAAGGGAGLYANNRRKSA